jgi:RsiW-degrading membrane proteinase PrsW (M82 family)
MFIAAGLVEETLKYLPIAYARRRYGGIAKEGKPQHRNRAYIDYALSAALSFGLLESFDFIYAARDDTWPKFLLTLVERLVIGQVGHLSAAALTALRAIRRDYYGDGDDLSWWGVVGPAVMFHGMFNFVAISGSAVEGNVGWIHPSNLRIVLPGLGVMVGMVATLVGRVRREWVGIEDLDQMSRTAGDDEAKK